MTKTMILMGLVAMAAAAGDPEFLLPVCADGGSIGPEWPQAKAMAQKMFATIGADLRWHSAKNCPQGGIRIVLSTGAPLSKLPGALAYALPFADSQRIEIFLDRVQRSTDRRYLSFLLAHVMAHEIGHVLERTDRHSATGVMKAHWSRREISEMSVRPLAFTPQELMLIRSGLAARTVTNAGVLQAALE